MFKESNIRKPLILGHKTYHDITNDIVSPIEGPAPKQWKIAITIALIVALYGVGCISYLVGVGIGSWGLNKTVGWAWDITNFVWWVGIGHAGTLISAVLLLFRQRWRMAINRSAEAIPDFATIRDRVSKPWMKKFYSILSFGWSGRAKHWTRFEEISLVLAGIATPLVFSVHSIVSMDFATSIVPGWHTTIFPPYFVSGAIFSGFAMVQTLLLIMRKTMKLEAYIHLKHIEYMNIVIIVTGSIVGVAYLTELFISDYSGVQYESYAFINRFSGPLAWSYWCMMTCNVISPQLFWFKKLRTNLVFTFVMSIIVNIGMWFERFVIIVTSIHRDYLPAAWGEFKATTIDIGMFIGTIGIFFTLFLLFARYFPVLALNELKTILKTSGESYKNQQNH